MPEESRADADQWAIGELLLALRDDIDSALVDDHLVEAGLDQTTSDVLELLAGLHQEVVAGRDFDGDALARVAGPDVQTWVARAAVDGEEVEIGVEAGEDGILLAVLFEVRGGGGKKMGAVLGGNVSLIQDEKPRLVFRKQMDIPVFALILKGASRQAETNGSHLSETLDGALHRGTPLLHGRVPALLDVWRLRNDILRVQAGELGLVGRLLGHAPEETALGIRVVAGNIQWPLLGRKALDDVQTWLVNGALGLLGVLQSDTNLPAQLGTLILAELLFGLRKVVFEEIEEGLVVLLCDARIVENEGAVGDESFGGLFAFGLDFGGVNGVVEVDVEVDDRKVHGNFLGKKAAHGECGGGVDCRLRYCRCAVIRGSRICDTPKSTTQWKNSIFKKRQRCGLGEFVIDRFKTQRYGSSPDIKVQGSSTTFFLPGQSVKKILVATMTRPKQEGPPH